MLQNIVLFGDTVFCVYTSNTNKHITFEFDTLNCYIDNNYFLNITHRLKGTKLGKIGLCITL